MCFRICTEKSTLLSPSGQQKQHPTRLQGRHSIKACSGTARCWGAVVSGDAWGIVRGFCGCQGWPHTFTCRNCGSLREGHTALMPAWSCHWCFILQSWGRRRNRRHDAWCTFPSERPSLCWELQTRVLPHTSILDSLGLLTLS